MDYFTTFLTFLSAMVPALAGTMIADYFFIRKGRPENFKPLRGGISAPGVVSFAVGAVFAMVTGGTFVGTPLEMFDFPLFIGPVNGIVVSMILYVIIYKAMKLPAFGRFYRAFHEEVGRISSLELLRYKPLARAALL